MNGPRTVLRIPAYTTEGHEPMPQDIPDERFPAGPTPTHQDHPVRPSASLSDPSTDGPQ